MKKRFYSIGLMSGTSMDGVDASIIKSDGEKSAEIVDDLYVKYDDITKSELKNIVDLCTTKNIYKKFIKKIKKIENKITLLHARACKKIIKRNKKINIDLIGFHGQTILHKPKNGYSIQIGDSQLLSNITEKKVISNFREKDILKGGQGAPLASLYHKLVLSKLHIKLPSAIINIGGISNITYLKNKNILFSYDIGPGNCLIDKWVKKKSSFKFDNKGKLANAGKTDLKILNKFLKDSYYNKKLPKSLDVKKFNLKYLKNLNLKDGCNTLSMVTIKSICKSIKNLNKAPKIILFSGGGRKNKFIISKIKKSLKIPIYLIDDFNLNGDFIESQAFAYLAIRSFLNKYISTPQTTGVSVLCKGGNLYTPKL